MAHHKVYRHNLNQAELTISRLLLKTVAGDFTEIYEVGLLSS